MKTFLQLIISAILITGCKATAIDNTEAKIDLDFVVSRFQENSDQIKKVEYHIQRIDSSAQGGPAWNNKGTVLIEKDAEDDIFGFTFYANVRISPKSISMTTGVGSSIQYQIKPMKWNQGPDGF